MEQLGLVNKIRTVETRSFRDLALQIAKEKSMLHPNANALRQSFFQGLAAIRYSPETGKILSYARLEPLITPKTKKDLGLPSYLPNVVELGTVFVSAEKRGNGEAPAVQNELLTHVKQEMIAGNLLVILTAIPVPMMKTTIRAKDVDIYFHGAEHNEFEMIAPWTCVCKPDFGSGFQYGTFCPVRVSRDLRPVNENLLTVMNNAVDGLAACTMFVSDKSLAQKTNDQLVGALGNQPNLVNILKKYGYYGPEFKNQTS